MHPLALLTSALFMYISGVPVTGHEKGSIVVWHNIVTYYLTALSNATTTTAPATTTTTTTARKSEKKKELKKAKQVANAESTVAMPISTTLHWHAHSGMLCCIVLCCVVLCCAMFSCYFPVCVFVVSGINDTCMLCYIIPDQKQPCMSQCGIIGCTNQNPHHFPHPSARGVPDGRRQHAVLRRRGGRAGGLAQREHHQQHRRLQELLPQTRLPHLFPHQQLQVCRVSSIVVCCVVVLLYLFQVKLLFCEVLSTDANHIDFFVCALPTHSSFHSASLVSGINVAVTTTDNAVHVINTATMREDWTVRSLCITSRRESVPRRRQIKAETGE